MKHLDGIPGWEGWGIFSPSGAGEPIAERTAFSIMFSAHQVVECSEKLTHFADGFESP